MGKVTPPTPDEAGANAIAASRQLGGRGKEGA